MDHDDSSLRGNTGLSPDRLDALAQAPGPGVRPGPEVARLSGSQVGIPARSHRGSIGTQAPRAPRLSGTASRPACGVASSAASRTSTVQGALSDCKRPRRLSDSCPCLGEFASPAANLLLAGAAESSLHDSLKSAQRPFSRTVIGISQESRTDGSGILRKPADRPLSRRVSPKHG